MSILVTGREGQVARSLIEKGERSGTKVVSLSRPELDLAASPDAILEAIVRAGQDVRLIVNAAAYTSVDKAESEPEAAMAVNARGAGAVSRAAVELGIPIIHLSTDYVFDGEKGGAWIESDPVNPLGAYGRSKLEGEREVAEANDRHVILRTAWVYSPFGQNFVKTILRLSAERDRLTIVADQAGTPTSALDIAEAILTIARRLETGPASPDHYGVFHLAGTGATNWADFARSIVAGAAGYGRPAAEIASISTSQYPTPARRPANSVLATDRIRDVYGVGMPHWKDSLAIVLARLLAD